MGYTEEQMGTPPYQYVLGLVIPAFFCFSTACSGSSTPGDGDEGDPADLPEYADADDSLEDKDFDIAETEEDDLPPIPDSDNDTIGDAHEGEHYA